MDTIETIRRRFEALSPHLDEKSLRLFVAAETLQGSVPERLMRCLHPGTQSQTINGFSCIRGSMHQLAGLRTNSSTTRRERSA